MVIQPRADTIRLFKQHDHALTCGEMARFWRGFEGADVLDFEAMLAIAMHDCGWIEEDKRVSLDPKTGWPYDFIRMPIPQRIAIYKDAIDGAERVSEYAGVLVSVHFSGFVGEVDPAFGAAEEARRQRLRASVGARANHGDRDYFALRTLDLLSLAVCLTPPSSDPAHHPRWLTGEINLGGTQVALDWDGDARLRVTPSPLSEPVHIRLPYSEIERREYASQDELEDAWTNATHGVVEVTVG